MEMIVFDLGEEARDISTKTERLIELAKNENSYIRSTVSHNINTPIDVLRKLAKK